ncbi:MAG TPA: hypothetical protein PLG31_03880 [Spirochaetota bacterium]|nr:hypothetical protein [Spirochaetota bacterium]
MKIYGFSTSSKLNDRRPHEHHVWGSSALKRERSDTDSVVISPEARERFAAARAIDMEHARSRRLARELAPAIRLAIDAGGETDDARANRIEALRRAFATGDARMSDTALRDTADALLALAM